MFKLSSCSEPFFQKINTSSFIGVHYEVMVTGTEWSQVMHFYEEYCVVKSY